MPEEIREQVAQRVGLVDQSVGSSSKVVGLKEALIKASNKTFKTLVNKYNDMMGIDEWVEVIKRDRDMINQCPIKIREEVVLRALVHESNDQKIRTRNSVGVKGGLK